MCVIHSFNKMQECLFSGTGPYAHIEFFRKAFVNNL